MTPVVMWTGPLNLAQVPGATVPGARELNFGCTGNGVDGNGKVVPQCSVVGASWGGVDGMLHAGGVDPSTVGDVFLGGFSAGGGALNALLSTAPSRARVKFAHYADAIGGQAVNEALVAYGVDCLATGRQALVVTSSNATGPYRPVPGNVGLRMAVDALRQRTGAPLEETDGSPWAGLVSPVPVRLYHTGSVWLADYEGLIGHDHVSIAPAVWQRVMLPWLGAEHGAEHGEPATSLPGSPVGSSGAFNTVLFALAGLAGYTLARMVTSGRA